MRLAPSQIGSTRQVQTSSAIKIAVYPVTLMAGRAVQVTWRVDPDPLNREWCVAFEGEMPWRTFCETIPHNRRIWQQQLEPPAGQYDVELTVTRADGRRLRSVATLCVVGGDVSCGPQELISEVPQ